MALYHAMVSRSLGKLKSPSTKCMIFLLMYIIMGIKSLQILTILVAICQGRSGVESPSPFLSLPCSSVALNSSSLLSLPRLMWAWRSPTQGQLSLWSLPYNFTIFAFAKDLLVEHQFLHVLVDMFPPV